MRSLFTIFFVFAAMAAIAQESLSFTEVVENPGVSQKELYGRAKLWFADSYKSAKAVIQTDDPEVGQIVGKPLFKFSPGFFMGGEAVAGNINYTVKVFCKDGKFKYDITDFRHESFGLITTEEECPWKMFGSNKKFREKTWKEAKESCKAHAESLIKTLKSTMGKKSDADF